MISALTCLFIPSLFLLSYIMSDTCGPGNLLLTLSVPSPARLLKMKEIQIETHTYIHTPTHPQGFDKNSVIPGK